MAAAPSTPNAIASTADFEFAALNEAKNYRAALVTSFRPWLAGDILEVGAGIGQISRAIRQLPAVKSLVAVEPDSKFVPALREALPNDTVIAGTADDLPAGRSWDALVNINVLEHIEHDAAELSAYRRLLAPRDGHLCLFVPARPEIYAPLDKDFGHFRRYRAPALRTLLEEAGFRIVKMRYYNLLGYAAWWWSFKVRRSRSFNPAAIRFYDRFLFPPVFAFEHYVCRPPIGQNLLVVAQAR